MNWGNPVGVTQCYFDIDLYLDLVTPPAPLNSGLPPGEYKYWLNHVPSEGTVTIMGSVVLFGEQSHQLYARVDTIHRIVETDESNNVTLKSIEAAGAPGGSIVLGTKCGQVEEGGNGLVVIDAANTILNQADVTHLWQPIVMDDIQRGGAPLPGATVWAFTYPHDDSLSRAVFKSYSIQDGTFRFFCLPPGHYILYAEFADANGTFSGVRLIPVYSGTDIQNITLNLMTG